MGMAKAAAFVALMFALGAAQDRLSQAALKILPLPWVVATLHFGAGMLWVFPAWTIGLRQTPSLNDIQKKRVTPLAFLHAAGHVCALGALGAGSLAVTHIFQATEPIAVSVMSWMVVEKGQHLVAWLALLPLVAGVGITFWEGIVGSWVANIAGACGVLLCGARTTFSQQVMRGEAVALKGQLCSVVFVSGCLVLLPFAIVMEGSQVVGQWERSAAEVGSSVLIIKLVQGGTYFYMWSECLFGLIEEAGAAVAAVTVAIRPVAVYAFSAMLLGESRTLTEGAGAVLATIGAVMFVVAKHKYMLKVRRSKQQ